MPKQHDPQAWKVIGALRKLIQGALALQRGGSSRQVEERLTFVARSVWRAMEEPEQKAFFEEGARCALLEDVVLVKAFGGELPGVPVRKVVVEAPRSVVKHRWRRVLDLYMQVNAASLKERVGVLAAAGALWVGKAKVYRTITARLFKRLPLQQGVVV